MFPQDTSTWTNDDWSGMRVWLKELLAHNKVTVTFVKKDGTNRTMLCTTDPSLLPKQVTERVEHSVTQPKKENMDTLAVYDLEKEGWRSFTVKSITQVTVKYESVE
jgi:hypothetical protein